MAEVTVYYRFNQPKKIFINEEKGFYDLASDKNVENWEVNWDSVPENELFNFFCADFSSISSKIISDGGSVVISLSSLTDQDEEFVFEGDVDSEMGKILSKIDDIIEYSSKNNIKYNMRYDENFHSGIKLIFSIEGKTKYLN